MIKITTAHTANRNKNARKSFPISYHLPRLKFCRGKSVGQPPYVTAPSSVPSSEGLFYSIKKRRFLSTPASAGKHNPCFAWQLFFLPCAPVLRQPPLPKGGGPPTGGGGIPPPNSAQALGNESPRRKRPAERAERIPPPPAPLAPPPFRKGGLSKTRPPSVVSLPCQREGDRR